MGIARAGGGPDPGGAAVAGAGRGHRAHPVGGVVDSEQTGVGGALDLERVGSVGPARDARDGGAVVGVPSGGGGLEGRVGDEVAIGPYAGDRPFARRGHEWR